MAKDTQHGCVRQVEQRERPDVEGDDDEDVDGLEKLPLRRRGYKRLEVHRAAGGAGDQEGHLHEREGVLEDCQQNEQSEEDGVALKPCTECLHAWFELCQVRVECSH